MSKSKITKVRIHETKKGRGLVISSIDTDANGEEINNPGAIHKALIHKNLQSGLDALAIHFAVMAGYVKPKEVEDIIDAEFTQNELAESFRVKGYSLGGDEDEGTAGVIISGHKILANGMAHNFNTPFYKFEQAPQSRYIFMDDLIVKLNYLEERIIAYKEGTERGDPAQTEMEFEEPVTKLQIDEPIIVEAKVNKKKNGTMKKVKQTAENPSGVVVE